MFYFKRKSHTLVIITMTIKCAAKVFYVQLVKRVLVKTEFRACQSLEYINVFIKIYISTHSFEIVKNQKQCFDKGGFAGVVATDKYGDVTELKFGELGESTEILKAD